MVLLSADGSEEKVYKKITVADPTSCKKKKKRKKKGHQIRQLRATFGHSFGPVCGNLKELIFKRFKCLGVAGAVGGGGRREGMLKL